MRSGLGMLFRRTLSHSLRAHMHFQRLLPKCNAASTPPPRTSSHTSHACPNGYNVPNRLDHRIRVREEYLELISGRPYGGASPRRGPCALATAGRTAKFLRSRRDLYESLRGRHPHAASLRRATLERDSTVGERPRAGGTLRRALRRPAP